MPLLCAELSRLHNASLIMRFHYEEESIAVREVFKNTYDVEPNANSAGLNSSHAFFTPYSPQMIEEQEKRTHHFSVGASLILDKSVP
jgi:hypothetical protein